MAKRTWMIEARKARNLTRQEVADGVDVHQTYIEKLENGSRAPSIKVAVRLGKVLGIPPEEIINKFFAEQIRRAAL